AVGRQRDPGDEQPIEEIVRLCGLLPLAVCIAGARLKTSRALNGPHLLARLWTEQDRLTTLDDGARSVAAALAVSYLHLPAEQQAAFTALGLHPSLEYEPYATAALLDTSPQRAQRLLDALDQVNLPDQPPGGRCGCHDLVRAYAMTSGARTETDSHDALGRLYNHYAHATSTAMDLAYPYETDQRPAAPTPVTASPHLDDEAAALTWLDAELDNLLAAAHHAVDHGWPDHTTHQSATLRRPLRTRGQYHQAHTLHQHALNVSRTHGNTMGELDALTALGCIHRLQGRYGPATTCFEQAIDLARSIGKLRDALDAWNGLGRVHHVQGKYDQAADCYGQALRLAHDTGSHAGKLDALNGLGQVHYFQGRHGSAAECYAQALKVAHAIGSRSGEIEALIGVAYVNFALRRHGPAAAGFERVLDLVRGSGHRAGEPNALIGL